ncbi:hypothetical protein [Chamaesiphon sp.]|uniref:hypothetical protein n=1 Tax=Chamaesiphon sp. TaxID=2814140 RepID=UPI003592E9CD
MPLIATLSQLESEESSVTSCAGCPLSRHLYADRYACGNSLGGVVSSRQALTAECHDAILHHPERHFQPLPLPDLQGLDPEIVCSYVGVSLNWLNVHEEREINDGENVVEVSHENLRIGDLKQKGAAYYCDRVKGLESVDAHEIALSMIHPDFLYGAVEEILAFRAAAIDYM